MPKLSEFFGISIYVYWGEHGPPHFHARYAGQKASIAIEDLSILAGPGLWVLSWNGQRSTRMNFARFGEGR